MKKIILSFLVALTFTVAASAQEDQNDAQDKIQQEPPREAQRAVERSATKEEVNKQNEKAAREAEEKLQKEKEKSTGKENKNPATTIPVTEKPKATPEPAKQRN